MADGTLKVGTITTSSGSGTITIPNTVTVAGAMANTPAFRAYKSGNTTLSDATQTAVVYDSEFFDTDNVYDTSTGIFTVPSGKGGKYFLNTVTRITGGTANAFLSAYVQFEINGTNNEYRQRSYSTSGGNFNNDSIELNGVIDLSAGDAVKVTVLLNVASGTAVLVGASGANAVTTFGAYKIIE
jgi:hypothetical protein